MSFTVFAAPISKEKAGELSKLIEHALHGRHEEIPEAKALKIVKKQLDEYRKTGEAPKGILTWFQDRFELSKDDGKYVADIATLASLYTGELLKKRSPEDAAAHANEAFRRKARRSSLVRRLHCEVVPGEEDETPHRSKCLISLKPVFEAILDDKRPPPPMP